MVRRRRDAALPITPYPFPSPLVFIRPTIPCRYDAECKKKKKQAEECLASRAAETAKKRGDNNTWRIPGSVPDRGLL